MQRTAASRDGKGVLALPFCWEHRRVGCGQWAEGAAPALACTPCPGVVFSLQPVEDPLQHQDQALRSLLLWQLSVSLGMAVSRKWQMNPNVETPLSEIGVKKKKKKEEEGKIKKGENKI